MSLETLTLNPTGPTTGAVVWLHGLLLLDGAAGLVEIRREGCEFALVFYSICVVVRACRVQIINAALGNSLRSIACNVGNVELLTRCLGKLFCLVQLLSKALSLVPVFDKGLFIIPLRRVDAQ